MLLLSPRYYAVFLVIGKVFFKEINRRTVCFFIFSCLICLLILFNFILNHCFLHMILYIIMYNYVKLVPEML